MSDKMAIYIPLALLPVCYMLRMWRRDYSVFEHKRISVHESGHAIIYYLLFNSVPNYITNKYNSRCNSRGSMNIPEISFITSTDYENMIMVLYGGSVAEETYFGNIGNGLYSDRKKASLYIDYMAESRNKYSNDPIYKKSKHDELEEYYNKAKMLMEVNEDILENLSNCLNKHRFLLKHHIEDILKNNKKDVTITWTDKIIILFKFYEAHIF